jgi:hypothetical protein
MTINDRDEMVSDKVFAILSICEAKQWPSWLLYARPVAAPLFNLTEILLRFRSA